MKHDTIVRAALSFYRAGRSPNTAADEAVAMARRSGRLEGPIERQIRDVIATRILELQNEASRLYEPPPVPPEFKTTHPGPQLFTSAPSIEAESRGSFEARPPESSKRVDSVHMQGSAEGGASPNEKSSIEYLRLLRRVWWMTLFIHGVLAVPLYCSITGIQNLSTISGLFGVAFGAAWSWSAFFISSIFIQSAFRGLSEIRTEHNLIAVALSFWNLVFFGSFVFLLWMPRGG